jgi:transposase
MVQLVRGHVPQREVARRFGVSLFTVQYWVAHAKGKRLDRVDFRDRPRGPRRAANRVDERVEQKVVAIRKELRTSDLGYHGAVAVRAQLLEQQFKPLPSLPTINRIRQGQFDATSYASQGQMATSCGSAK